MILVEYYGGVHEKEKGIKYLFQVGKHQRRIRMKDRSTTGIIIEVPVTNLNA